MLDILHKVEIKSSSQSDVYKALTTVEGLSAWWTNNTQGESKVGGVLQFRFGAGGFDMKVLELHPTIHVLMAGGRGAQRMDRHKDRFRPKAARRLDHRSFQTPGLETAGGVHAPLQYQVGSLSAELKVTSRNR
jgi:hypothetical protein